MMVIKWIESGVELANEKKNFTFNSIRLIKFKFLFQLSANEGLYWDGNAINCLPDPPGKLLECCKSLEIPVLPFAHSKVRTCN